MKTGYALGGLSRIGIVAFVLMSHYETAKTIPFPVFVLLSIFVIFGGGDG